MKVVIGAVPMVEMKMLRWNSLILVFVIGIGCCANALGQREVTNFPSQLKDAMVEGSDRSGISKRTWLKADIDSPGAKSSHRIATLPKPDQATVPSPSSTVSGTDPNTLTPEMRKEIEEKIRVELEEKFQSQIEKLVRKQVKESQQSKSIRLGAPTMTGEILPLVPAKGYLLTDYTLRQKRPTRAQPTFSNSSGTSANFNDSNRRPVTRTLKDSPRVEGRVASIPLAKAEPAKPPVPTTTQPVETKTPATAQAKQPTQESPQQSAKDQVTLLPPMPSIELKNSKVDTTPNRLKDAIAENVEPRTSVPRAVPDSTSAALPVEDSLTKASEEQISVLNRPKQNVLRSSVVGPEFLRIGQAETFEIIVENQSGNEAKEVVVQLSVPEAITISRLDREAFLDRENRTISWRVPQIPGQSQEVIRYQATSRTIGKHPQTVKLGMDSILQGVTPFNTVVTNIPSQTIQLPTNNPPAAEVAERPTVEK